MENNKVVLTFTLRSLSLLKHPRKDFSMTLGSNKKYIFEFDADSFWDNKKIAAEFVSGPITLYTPVINMKCEIPDLIAKQRDFYLTIIGEDSNGVRFRTNRNRIIQNGG